jgi:hypothetical protein
MSPFQCGLGSSGVQVIPTTVRLARVSSLLKNGSCASASIVVALRDPSMMYTSGWFIL